jgi:hypothetical protein
MSSEPDYSDKGAEFSPCKRYRYSLWREWQTLTPSKKYVLFVMLNPSTADENILDPTVRRCLGYAMAWGYNKMVVANIFALRSTDPGELYKCEDPIGEENDAYIQKLAQEADMVIVAWGTHSKYKNRGEQVTKLLEGMKNIYYLQKTKNGTPSHPLYLKADLKPVNYYD